MAAPGPHKARDPFTAEWKTETKATLPGGFPQAGGLREVLSL